MCYIISNYKKDGKLINLVQDMNKVTKKYFKYNRKFKMTGSNVNFTKHRNVNEEIFLFTKTN